MIHSGITSHGYVVECTPLFAACMQSDYTHRNILGSQYIKEWLVLSDNM